MDVYNADVKNGANVQVHYFNGSAAQQWYVTNLGGGEYRIMSNLNRSYSLDVNSWNNANGTNVQIWQTTNDKFKLRKEGGHYADGTPINRHIIIPSFSDNHVLDVNRGSDPAKYDINVQIWHLANNNTNQYWAFESVNDVVFNYLNILDGYAKEYAVAHGYIKTELIFNYLRSGNPSYVGTQWSLLAGSIKSDFVNYVNQKNSAINFLRSPNLYIKDQTYGDIDFSHFSATMNALIYSGRDEGGWAGDLQSLVGDVKNITNESNDYSTLYNKFKQLIGADESISSFGMQDVLADIDARVIYEKSDYGSLIGDYLKSYYSSESSKRFSNFFKGYTKEQLKAHFKTYTNDKMSGTVRQPYYVWKNVSTVTENQSLAAATAFADFIINKR